MLRQDQRHRTSGFTLVELLVVIAIIATLMALLLPTLSRAHEIANLTKSRAWVNTLGDACEAYYHDNGYYPGQQYASSLMGDGGLFTGSQYLARTFFFQPNAADLSNSEYSTGVSQWVKAKNTDLVWPFHLNPGGLPIATNTILTDAKTNTVFPATLPIPPAGFWMSISSRLNNMPVLYFPARLGVVGVNQYKYNDNDLEPYKDTPFDVSGGGMPDDQAAQIAFWGPTGADAARTHPFGTNPPVQIYDYPPGFVTDSRLSPDRTSSNYVWSKLVPHNPGKFILVAPGMDNKYFGTAGGINGNVPKSYSDDNITYPNWN